MSRALRVVAVVAIVGLAAALAGCGACGRGKCPMSHSSESRIISPQVAARPAEPARPILPAASRDAICMPLIGQAAPAFKAETTQGPINFPADYAGKWVVLFSHPGDFTPVCTTEFMTFAKMQPRFNALNCALVGLSIDSTFSHIAWLRTIKEKVEYNGMKDVEVTFPVISDSRMEISCQYGMIHPDASNTKTVRALFIIDPAGKIRSIIYYPPTTGRNMREVERLLVSLQTADKHGIATPADWQPGDDVIVPPPNSCNAAKDRVATAAAASLRCVDWFLCFKKMPVDEPERRDK